MKKKKEEPKKIILSDWAKDLLKKADIEKLNKEDRWDFSRGKHRIYEEGLSENDEDYIKDNIKAIS